MRTTFLRAAKLKNDLSLIAIKFRTIERPNCAAPAIFTPKPALEDLEHVVEAVCTILARSSAAVVASSPKPAP